MVLVIYGIDILNEVVSFLIVILIIRVYCSENKSIILTKGINNRNLMKDHLGVVKNLSARLVKNTFFGNNRRSLTVGGDDLIFYTSKILFYNTIIVRKSL